MGELIGLVAVVMIFGIPMLAIWTKHQKEMRQHTGGIADGDAARLVEQVEVLQDRVEVLERIVTDRGYDLATQIEALRDARDTVAQATTRSPKETTR
ncbi:MAG: hypothetical protein J7496_14410 [Novosphingobium sp.]|nr:hypothetical protein [Novosphingobium sp.]